MIFWYRSISRDYLSHVRYCGGFSDSTVRPRIEIARPFERPRHGWRAQAIPSERKVLVVAPDIVTVLVRVLLLVSRSKMYYRGSTHSLLL